MSSFPLTFIYEAFVRRDSFSVAEWATTCEVGNVCRKRMRTFVLLFHYRIHLERWKREMHVTLIQHALYKFSFLLEKVSQHVDTYEKVIPKVTKTDGFLKVAC